VQDQRVCPGVAGVNGERFRFSLLLGRFHLFVSVGLAGTSNEGGAFGESQGSSDARPGNSQGRIL
jgi:hypothetical protein